MSPRPSLRVLGLARKGTRSTNSKRPLSPRFRFECLEDRVVPTIRPVMMSYLPVPIVAGQPAHLMVKATDGSNIVTTFTDNVTVTTTPGNVFLGSHHYTVDDQGVFDFPVTIPASTPAGQLGILCTDTDSGTFFPSVVDVVQPGGGGGGPKTFNLKIDNVEVPDDYDVAPGEKAKFFLNLSNDGTVACHGKTIAHVTIGTETIDVPITVNIGARGTQRLTVKIKMPELSLADIENLDAGDYDPAVTIDPIIEKIGGTPTGETNTGDNSATAANPLKYAYCFGNIDEDASPGAAFTPSSVDLPPEKLVTEEGETFIMHGAGKGQLVRSAGGWDLKFFDTNSTSLAESTGGHTFTLTSITANKPMKGLKMIDATAIGSLQFNGGLVSNNAVPAGLFLGNLGKAGVGTIVSIAAGDGVIIKVPKGIIQDTQLTAVSGIRLLEAQSWIDPDNGVNFIDAAFVRDITISAGDFVPDITTTGLVPQSAVSAPYGIQNVDINGGVSGLWVAGATGARAGIGNVAIVGDANGWNLSATGPVQGVTIAGDFSGDIGATTGALDTDKDPFSIDKIKVLGKISGTLTAGDASHADVDIGKVTVGGASNWTIMATGTVQNLWVKGNWDTGSLEAATIYTVRVDGIVAVDHIGTTGTLSKGDESIAGLRFGAVAGLVSLTAPSGIGQLLADTWLNATNISAKWIGDIEVKGQFPASMVLTGVDDVTGDSIFSAVIGTIGGPPSLGSTSSWDVAGNIRSIKATIVENTNITAHGDIGSFVQSKDKDADVQFHDALVKADGRIGVIVVRSVGSSIGSGSVGFSASSVLSYHRYFKDKSKPFVGFNLFTPGIYDDVNPPYKLTII